MRKPALLPALAACALAAACGAPGPTVKTSNANANSQAANSQTSIQHGASPASDAGVAASHGGAPAASATKPPVETPELDAKIEKAEAKAKAAGASDADKKAAARAYFERANFFRDQGSPALYKFALADYRRGLRYDPADEDARAKMDEIVSIYKSMGRPVPELGNEQ